MTIEIRQMVIKSSIEGGEAVRTGTPALAEDGDEDSGNSEGNLGGSEERRRLRVLFAMTAERMRER